jgi:recombination protein RecR
MAQKFPDTLLSLISHLKKLPGVGTRTAERFAFELISWDASSLSSFGDLCKQLLAAIPPCAACGCLSDRGVCPFCSNRDPNALCILASPKDAYAIEEIGHYRGLYHVIEHLLSPLDGRHTSALRIDRIRERIEKHGVKEVIIAFDSTLEGDTTALYLKNALADLPIGVSRLAFGLPVGSSLEYIDGGTLARAFQGRQMI